MNKKIFIICIIIVLMPCAVLSQKSTIKIHKGYLKYNRDKALKYASKWWHSTNSTGGYQSFYGQGGDCANFCSQILIAGDFRELVTGVPIKLTSDKLRGGPTITGAMQLASRLTGYPLAEPNELEGGKRTTLNELNVGDIIYMKVVKNGVSTWAHVMALNNVAAKGVTGHTPHEFWPFPRFGNNNIWQKQLDINASVLHTYNIKYIYGVPVYSANIIQYSKAKYDWIIPTEDKYVNTATKTYTKTYNHIPDVPVITKMEVFETDSSNQQFKYNYQALLDDTANNGDGAIVIGKRKNTVNPVILKKDMNLFVRMNFRVPIDISGKHPNDKNDKHKVRLVKMETKTSTVNGKQVTTQSEKSFIILKDPEVTKDGESLKYTIPVEELMKTGETGRWTIEVRAFSKSDSTPLNGNGTYAKYEDKPDINHWFEIEPLRFKVINAEILKLHLPLIKGDSAYPVTQANMVMYNILSSFAIPSGESYSDYNPNYYLGKTMLGGAIRPLQEAIEDVGKIAWVNTFNKKIFSEDYSPVYYADLKTEKITENNSKVCAPLDITGEKTDDYRQGIRLKLTVSPFKKSGDGERNLINSSAKTVYDLTNEVDLFTHEFDPCLLTVAIPLERIYGADGANYPDGKQTLVMQTYETVDDGDNTTEKLLSTASLSFIKDVEPPVDTGETSAAAKIKDSGSGFNNMHADKAYVC